MKKETAESVKSELYDLLIEAIDLLIKCEQKWGCECPYCDRNFGEEFDKHADNCKLQHFLDQTYTVLNRTGKKNR